MVVDTLLNIPGFWRLERSYFFMTIGSPVGLIGWPWDSHDQSLMWGPSFIHKLMGYSRSEPCTWDANAVGHSVKSRVVQVSRALEVTLSSFTCGISSSSLLKFCFEC